MWIISDPHCWSDHGEYVVVVAIILLGWWWTTTTTIHPCMPIIYQQEQQQQHPRHHHCNTPIDEPLAWPWRVDIGPTGFTERSYSSSLPQWKQVSPPGGSMTFKSCARGDQIYEIRSSGQYHHHHPSQTTMMLLLLLQRRRIIIIIIIFIQRHIHSP